MSDFAFQDNSKLSVFYLGRKPVNDETHEDFKFNTVRHWGTISNEGSDNPQLELIKKLEKGITIRYGIKEKSNRKEDFEYADGTAIDLDCHSLKDLMGFLTLDIARQAFYRHPSFSFDGVSSFGYRLHYRFNRRVTDALEMKMINYALMLEFKPELIEWFTSRDLPNLQGLDKSCNDPARLWYSGDPAKVQQYKAEGLIVQNLDNVLNVDVLLEYLEPEVKDYVNRSHSKDAAKAESIQQALSDRESSFSKEFYEHLDQVLGTNNNPHAIIPYLQAYLENCGCTVAGWHEHTSPGDAVWQYRSADPLDPNGSETSDSFSFSRVPDGSYVWNSPKFGTGGDLILLLYTAQSRSDQYIPYIKHSDKMATANHFLEFNGFAKLPEWKPSPEQKQKRVENIQSFNSGIPGLFFSQKGQPQIDPQSILDWFLKQTPDWIKFCEQLQCFYVYNSKHWEIKSFDDLINLIVNTFVDNYSFVDMDEYTIPMKRLFTSGITNELKNQLKLLDKKIYGESIKMLPKRYVPFQNGVFDVDQKELIPYPFPQAWNFTVNDINYQPSTGKGLEVLRSLLRLIIDTKPEWLESSIEDVIGWGCCNAQYKAYETLKGLWFVGDANGGKTSVSNLFSEVVQNNMGNKNHQLVGIVKIDKLLAEDKEFVDSLVGKTCVIVPECNGIPRGNDGSRLKDAIATPDIRGFVYSYNKKYVQGDINVYAKCSFMFTSQEMPRLPKGNDQGFLRRLMLLKIKATKYSRDVEKMFCLLNPYHNAISSYPPEFQQECFDCFQDLMCSMVEADVRPVIQRLSGYGYNPEWLSATRKELDQANSSISKFIVENLKFDPDCVGIEAGILFNTYEGWCTENTSQYAKVTKDTFFKELPHKIMEQFSGCFPDLKAVKKRKKSGILYQSIRLKNTEDFETELESELEDE